MLRYMQLKPSLEKNAKKKPKVLACILLLTYVSANARHVTFWSQKKLDGKYQFGSKIVDSILDYEKLFIYIW